MYKRQHLGKVKNGPNEGESLAPVAAALEAKLGQKVTFEMCIRDSAGSSLLLWYQ